MKTSGGCELLILKLKVGARSSNAEAAAAKSVVIVTAVRMDVVDVAANDD